jgi:hypothetical protein
MTLLPGTRICRYEIRSQIGSGWMGDVYLFVEMTLREAAAAAALGE